MMSFRRFLISLFHRHDWVRLNFYDHKCAACGLLVQSPRPKR